MKKTYLQSNLEHMTKANSEIDLILLNFYIISPWFLERTVRQSQKQFFLAFNSSKKKNPIRIKKVKALYYIKYSLI